MSQTSVTAGGQPIGYAGQIADNGPHDIVSGFNKDTVQLPFGIGVRLGATQDAYVSPTGFSTVLPVLGVNVWSADHNRAGTADPNGNFSGDMGSTGLVVNSSMQVMRRGRILAIVEQAVLPGQRAYCRGIPTGTLGQGLWAATNFGASYHVDTTSSAVFRTGSFTAADGSTLVAVLEVNFVNRP